MGVDIYVGKLFGYRGFGIVPFIFVIVSVFARFQSECLVVLNGVFVRVTVFFNNPNRGFRCNACAYFGDAGRNLNLLNGSVFEGAVVNFAHTVGNCDFLKIHTVLKALFSNGFHICWNGDFG